jgi:hypothetical protein
MALSVNPVNPESLRLEPHWQYYPYIMSPYGNEGKGTCHEQLLFKNLQSLHINF